MKLLYTLFFICFFTFANAQAPGYMGKRNFIEYDLYYMIAVGGPTINNKMYAYNNLGISTRHNFRFNHVINRSGVIGIGYDYFKTGIGIDYKDAEDNFQSAFSKLKVTAICLHYDKYFMKQGSLAPVGLYHHFEGKYITGSVVDEPFNEVVQKTFYTGYGIGLKKIFKENFFVNFSGQIGWTWGDRNLDTLQDDFEKNVKTRINKRIYSHYIFENNIGIGILLF